MDQDVTAKAEEAVLCLVTAVLYLSDLSHRQPAGPDTQVPGLGDLPSPGPASQINPYLAKEQEILACPTLPAPCPAGVVLDWRHARIGPPAPCVLCGRPALCRSPVKDVPCHKGCAEAWITATPATQHPARLIAPHTPDRGCAMLSFRVIYHGPSAPTAVCDDITTDEVETGDGLTETALICRACGTAWPVACVSDWTVPPGPPAPDRR